jgi:hypothetical protein
MSEWYLMRQADQQTHELLLWELPRNTQMRRFEDMLAARPRRYVARRTLVGFVPVILDPLGDIAVHVMHAPMIGWIVANLTGAMQP